MERFYRRFYHKHYAIWIKKASRSQQWIIICFEMVLFHNVSDFANMKRL